MLFYPPLEAEALPINTPLDPPRTLKMSLPILSEHFSGPHICFPSYACTGTEPCEAPHYCKACYQSEFLTTRDGVRFIPVTVRTPLSEAKWFKPVLHTKEGYSALRETYNASTPHAKKDVRQEDPKQDKPEKE